MFLAEDVPKHMLAFHQALRDTIEAAKHKTGTLESLTNLSQFMIGFESAVAIEKKEKISFLKLYVNFITWTQLSVPLEIKTERIKYPASWQSYSFGHRHYMQVNYIDPNGIARAVRIYKEYVIKGTSSAALQGVTLQATPQGMIRYNPHSRFEQEGVVCMRVEEDPDAEEEAGAVVAILELPFNGKSKCPKR